MLEREKELEDQNAKHLEVLEEEKAAHHQREEHLKNEIDFVKTSFHAYKVNLRYRINISYFLFLLLRRSILRKKTLNNFKQKLMRQLKG